MQLSEKLAVATDIVRKLVRDIAPMPLPLDTITVPQEILLQTECEQGNEAEELGVAAINALLLSGECELALLREEYADFCDYGIRFR